MTSAFGNYYTHRQALVKILLMLLRNYCAKIATKKRKHNTNSTGMSVNLVVCVLAVLSLSGAEKGRGQLMRYCLILLHLLLCVSLPSCFYKLFHLFCLRIQHRLISKLRRISIPMFAAKRIVLLHTLVTKV